MDEHLQTEGVTKVGEVISRTMREAIVADDYRNSFVAGADMVLHALGTRLERMIACAGPYDDTRALADFLTWSRDSILRIHTPEFFADESNGIL